MSIPHRRHQTPDKNRMRIDPAAAVADALPFPSRREGAGKWRTRGLCHGSAEKPDSASLIFHDPEHEGGPLAVHCYKCQPRTAADRDRIRHALQNATGLTLCRCDACWQAWRQGAQTAPGTRNPRNPTQSNQSNANKGAESDSKPKSGQDRGGPDGDRTHTTARDWGAHSFKPDDSGGRSHAADCPQCGQDGALTAWTLADHRFPYCGLALTCSCGLTYDRLHKTVAGRIAQSGRRWRQDAVYTLADGRKRARIRTDPDKRLWWDSALRGAPVKGRLPLAWHYGRGLTCGPALIVEGEKAAAACVSAGMDATHVVYSVGDAAGLYQSDYRGLAGRAVTLWADNDQAGIDAALKAIPRLMDAGAAAIAVVETRGFETRADAADIPTMAIRRAVHTAERIRA